MGCSQSKIENEELVSRCKDRKLLTKSAVAARKALSAAQTAYAISLKNCGAAFRNYAHVEAQNPELVLNQLNLILGPPGSMSSFNHLPPPPPPPPNFPPSALHRASTMPISKLDPKSIRHMMEEEVVNQKEGSRTSRVVNRNLPEAKEVGSGRKLALQNQYHPTWDYFFSLEIPGPGLGDQVLDKEVSVDKEETEKKGFANEVNRMNGEEEKSDLAASLPEPVPKVIEKGSKKAKRVKASNFDLLKIFVEVDDHFVKASESAHEVSKLLEGTRLHYHSNFADNPELIDHSARLIRLITWNQSYKGIPNIDAGKYDIYREEQETHATVLDQLLAWEKKLFHEVKYIGHMKKLYRSLLDACLIIYWLNHKGEIKLLDMKAGELIKFEYQKKVTALNKLKKRGSNSNALQKVKASITHLHTRYIVDMQSLDSTVSEINCLRDEQLYPKLVQLVHRMSIMWETMQVHHESQSKIVVAPRSLDLSQFLKETTEHHRNCTVQLWTKVQEWHSQFDKLLKGQKDYIKALNSWLRLNLIPIESNLKKNDSLPPRLQNPQIQGLLVAWNDHLEKLPDELLRTAIFTFSSVVENIIHDQEEENKLKSKCEETRKELARKTRQFEEWYKRYIQRTKSDELDFEKDEENTHKDLIVEKQFIVDTVRKRLEEEEEAYQRQCVQVREKFFASLKDHLPQLFKALSDFALAISEMYKNLRYIS